MKIAITNMKAIYNNVEANKKMIKEYVYEASQNGAELILFPEFCLTGFGLDKCLLPSIIESVGIRQWFADLSSMEGIAIGASFLEYIPEENESYNTYGLFFSDRASFFHRKDIPTGLENFCYRQGDEEMVFDTPFGTIGIAMCWEQLRTVTVKRMKGKVDFVIAGSCWWGFSEEDGVAGTLLKEANSKLAKDAPAKMAEILGVPVFHSSHIGSFPSGSLTEFEKVVQRPIESESVAYNAYGKAICAKKSEQGIIYAEFDDSKSKGKEIDVNQDWLCDMPELLVKGFYTLNDRFSDFYQSVTRNKLKELWSKMNGRKSDKGRKE